MKTKEQCVTLAEYRRDVLRCPQSEIAHTARVKQGWISQIERGHLPSPWKREPIFKAYRLKEDEFIRMVNNVRKLRAIAKPTKETEPLFVYASPEELSQLLTLEGANKEEEAKQILTLIYEREVACA